LQIILNRCRQNLAAVLPWKHKKRLTYSNWRLKCKVAVMLDPLASKLEHYMDLLGKRQQLVAANIANADTPGYKAKDIDFQFEFMSQMDGGPPNVIEAQGLPVKNDGNNVSMERESRLLAENALRFSVASAFLRDQIKGVRSAIEEGK
jgi:flagellar basal-body rod protein FlgB